MLDIAELSSGLIGALIGGLLALVGVILAWLLQCALAWWIERNQVRAILQALNDEVEVLELIYMRRVGPALECNEGREPFGLYFPITSSYFSVYDSNCGALGRIRSANLRRAVIETYTHLKSLVDTFGYNNKLLIEYEELDRAAVENPQNDGALRPLNAKREELAGYADGLWKIHQEAMMSVLNLKGLIKAQLQSNHIP